MSSSSRAYVRHRIVYACVWDGGAAAWWAQSLGMRERGQPYFPLPYAPAPSVPQSGGSTPVRFWCLHAVDMAMFGLGQKKIAKIFRNFDH